MWFGFEVISLWFWWGVHEAQVVLIAASIVPRFLHCQFWCLSSFSWWHLMDSSTGFRSGQLTTRSCRVPALLQELAPPHWTSYSLDSMSLHSPSRQCDLDFQMKSKVYLNRKKGDFGPLSNRLLMLNFLCFFFVFFWRRRDFSVLLLKAVVIHNYFRFFFLSLNSPFLYENTAVLMIPTLESQHASTWLCGPQKHNSVLILV